MDKPSYKETLLNQRMMLQVQINKINKIIDILNENPQFEELIKLIQEQK